MAHLVGEGIIAMFGILLAFLTTRISREGPKINSILGFKISLWIVFLAILSTILITFLFYRFQAKRKLGKKEFEKGIFFNGPYNDASDYLTQNLKLWDVATNGEIGERALTDFSIEAGTIEVNRKNSAGRNIIKLLYYNSPSSKIKYIAKNTSSNSDRKFEVTFDARVIGSPITLYVIFHKLNQNPWYLSDVKKVTENVWKRFTVLKRVAPDLDLTIEFQEKDFEGTPGIYQIRDIVVRELEE